MIKIIIKNDKIGHGYYVSIVQKTKEACDIIEYFILTFKENTEVFSFCDEFELKTLTLC